MSLLPGDALSFCDFIDKSTTTLNFQAHTQQFLPRRAFEVVTKRSVIEAIVSNDEDISLGPQEKTAFVTKIIQAGPKLFVTCVYSDLPMSCLKFWLDSGVSDTDFPLTSDKRPTSWNSAYQRKFMSSFLGNQKRFNAPYFRLDSFQDLDDRSPMPVEFDEAIAKLRGKGAFGKVWEVKFHEDHHAFDCGKLYNHRFAMKVVQHEASMARERRFIHDIIGLEHHHLVKCFTSWKFGEKYYMIYELATWNLEEFVAWFKNPREQPELNDTWFMQQLSGLAGALRVVHNQESKDDLLGVPNAKRTAYFHDIKLDNILVFVYEGNIHWFRLSDFGCAKVADLIASISGHPVSQATTAAVGNPDYRPPESMGGQTSRPYDIWSLGCVYLELLVWFLQGYSELITFRAARRRCVRPGGSENEAFYFTDEEDSSTNVKLRPAVLDKIKELSAICPIGMKRLLDIIPTMLCIDPKKRPEAAFLAQQLKQFDNSNIRAPFNFGKGKSETLNIPVAKKSDSAHSDDSDSDMNPMNPMLVVHKPTDERD